MRNKRLLNILLVLLPVCGWAQSTASESDSSDGAKTEATTSDQQSAPEVPTRFVPKDKITPDQIISFPADI